MITHSSVFLLDIIQKAFKDSQVIYKFEEW